MKPLKMILANASRSCRRVALSEGSDPRVVSAAVTAARTGVARCLLIGQNAAVRAALALEGGEGIEGIEIHDPSASSLTPELTALYMQIRMHRGIDAETAQQATQLSHVYAALLVRAGYADGCLGGAVLTTAEIVRTALQIIGPAPGYRLVSSFFLMLFCAEHHAKKGAYIFADAGLVVDPNAEELAQIALASAESFTTLTGELASIGMLSFSTRGSASHSSVEKVRKATMLARAAAPDLMIDGELQFDAAFVAEVAESKAPDSPLHGDARVLVFPNLEAGNIGYKIAQRIGGAVAIGPILQGLAKPANDLSRGCSAEDVLHMIAVTAAQASALHAGGEPAILPTSARPVS